MARITDYAPIGNTCPIIDTVINWIESIDWDENNDEQTEYKIQSKEIVAEMEKIRQANTKLRQWGNELQMQIFDIDKDNDYLRKQEKTLTDEIEYLKTQIEH